MIRLIVIAVLLLAARPAIAAECLTLAQARKAWPTSYLSYRSTPAGRCWSAGHPRKAKIIPGNIPAPSEISTNSVPLPLAAPAVIRSQIELGHAAFEQAAPLVRVIKTIRITPP